MSRQRRARRGQAGLVRGCCLGVLLLTVLAVGAAVLATRALAAPDLGAAPGGTAHGNSEVVVAAVLAGEAAAQLITGPHAVVVLSEHDLTVIAQARNPSPEKYRNPQARIRNGDVLVSADTDLGPLGVTAVAAYRLSLSATGSATQVSAQPVAYEVGQVSIPGFVGDWLNPHTAATVNLTTLFASNAALEILSRALDCLSVQPDGVHVGFHRPGSGASDPACT